MLRSLIESKLQRPIPLVPWLVRARLNDLLESGLERGSPLLLVTAPAGYGKTTAVAAWISDRQHPAAWLSLERSDNEAGRFWHYLLTALQGVEPQWGRTVLPRLNAAMRLGVEIIVSSLLTDIEEHPPARPVLLILDDYHLISAPAIHDSLRFLIEHLPSGFHLVLLSRAEPPLSLARMRVLGRLTELHAGDLRFTPNEAAALLNEVMALGLSKGALSTLAEQTEGWVAGLQLAALSLKGASGREMAEFLATFSGTHRHVLAYLVEEALARQSEVVQRFLLHTSILPRLTPSLCDHMMGGEGSLEGEFQAAHALLTHLEREGLFTIRLDEAGHWFRYHHLFGEMLQNLLLESEPELVPDLHLRASEWYELHGHTEEAARHAIAAGAWERAAALLEQAGETLWGHGGLGALLELLAHFPEEIVRSHPRIALTYGWMLFLHDHWSEAETRWAQAEAALDAGSPAATGERGVLAAMRGALAAMRQNAAETIRLAGEAFRDLSAGDLTWRSVTSINLGLAYLARGEVLPSIHAFQEGAALCQDTGNTYLLFVALWHLAEAYLAAGRLRAAEHVFDRMEKINEQGEPHPLVLPGYARVGRGRIAYDRNELSVARELLDEAIAELPPTAQPRVLLFGLMTQARLAMALGDESGVLDRLDEATSLAERVGLREEMPVLAAFGACQALRMGHLAEAEQWARASRITGEEEADFRRECEHLVWARVRLARGDYRVVLALLTRLLIAADGVDRQGSVMEILILRALAHAGEQQPGLALADLRRALTLAEPEHIARLFLDEGPVMLALLEQLESSPLGPFIRALSNQLSHSPGELEAPPLTYEPLTARELDVLALLAHGLSNQQIAEELVISVGTVKGHINHILGKLDAPNRTGAVLRAQSLGLLRAS